MKSISNIHHKTSLPHKSTTTYTVEVLTWSITPPNNHEFITLGSHPLVAALVSEQPLQPFGTKRIYNIPRIILKEQIPKTLVSEVN